MHPEDRISAIWQLSEAIRSNAPIIHNLTSLVMQNDTADVIAAVGATQVTLHTREEARTAAGVAAAVAVNSGTLDEAWLAAVRDALHVAAARDLPWVFDPVAAGFTAYRAEAAHELLRRRPTIVKGNASEIIALSGHGEAGRAADSTHTVDQAADAARALARRFGCVVVVSGVRDLVTDGERGLRVANGDPLMGRMIGSGCMLTSVIACFLAVTGDAFQAAEAAVAYFTVAGEIAAARAQGPGTLKPLLIDALYNLDRQQLRERLRIETV